MVPAPVDGSYDIWRTSFVSRKNPSYILAYYAERQQLDSTEEQYDTYQSGISVPGRRRKTMSSQGHKSEKAREASATAIPMTDANLSGEVVWLVIPSMARLTSFR